MSVIFICNVSIAVFSKHLRSCISVNAALLHNVNKLQVALRDRMTKYVHLRAMVVYVVLALNLITRKRKNAAQRISERRVHDRPVVQTPRRSETHTVEVPTVPAMAHEERKVVGHLRRGVFHRR